MNCVCFVGLQDLGREFFSFFLRVGIGEILGRKYRRKKSRGRERDEAPSDSAISELLGRRVLEPDAAHKLDLSSSEI
jgi:hypothetical protein